VEEEEEEEEEEERKVKAKAKAKPVWSTPIHDRRPFYSEILAP
jgi:hypothetical protein